MTIHHAIVKSAAGKGVVFAYPDGDSIEATHVATGTKIVVDTEGFDSENDAAKEAWANVDDLATWNADDGAKLGLRIEQAGGTFHVLALMESGDDLANDEEFESLEDAIDYANTPVSGDEDGDEEEPDVTGSVVPAGFKQLYREIGVRQQDNGDFLAAIMAGHTIVLDGKSEVIDVDKVEALGYANGVDYPVSGYGPSLSGTRGWQGRYRMTVGNMLRKRIADAKVCHIPASLTGGKGAIEKTPPDAWCAKYATKVRKSVAKEADAAAADVAKPE